MTYTVVEQKKFKLTLDIHGELQMGDMSKSNNTGMKTSIRADSQSDIVTTNHLGSRCLFLDKWIVMSRVMDSPSSKLTFLFGCWKSNEKL